MPQPSPKHAPIVSTAVSVGSGSPDHRLLERLAAETGHRAAPDCVEAPRPIPSAQGVPVYVASVGGGDRSLYQGDYVLEPVRIRSARKLG